MEQESNNTNNKRSLAQLNESAELLNNETDGPSTTSTSTTTTTDKEISGGEQFTFTIENNQRNFLHYHQIQIAKLSNLEEIFAVPEMDVLKISSNIADN